jgi:hypothetical protein
VSSAHHRHSVCSAWQLWILIALLLAGCNEPSSDPSFDSHIQDLELVKLITGDEAIEAINKLHGMHIDVAGGLIAHYEGMNDKATIWVSEASSQDLAEEQVVVMIQKMKSNARSPFSHYRSMNKKGFRVIAFDGMGQVHYVFRDNKWVYWISANAKQIDIVLQHVSGAE